MARRRRSVGARRRSRVAPSVQLARFRPRIATKRPSPGITIEHHIDGYDRADVDFILAKYQDPRYRLLILHLGSVDAVGHMVTPLASRYARAAHVHGRPASRASRRAVDPTTTLLLVTGDHGMASRGTHGGEEEARLTPYALVGPGVQAGVKQDLKQTALTSTLLGLLGLPFLPVSEEPAGHDPARTRAGSRSALPSRNTSRASGRRRGHRGAIRRSRTERRRTADVNRALNEVLFGAEESRVGWRMLAAGLHHARRPRHGVHGVALGTAPARTTLRARASGARGDRAAPAWRSSATSFI